MLTLLLQGFIEAHLLLLYISHQQHCLLELSTQSHKKQNIHVLLQTKNLYTSALLPV